MSEYYQFDLKQYELLEKIGNGAYGEVYKVRKKDTGIIYAAKILECIFDQQFYEFDVETEEFKNITREINNLSKINHPSIVKFIGFSSVDFEGNPNPVIITEYVPNGTLKDLIQSERDHKPNPKWNATQKQIILYGIASAMTYLHKYKIIHRDLKPENILIDENFNPIISDFGFSKVLHQNNDSLTSPITKIFKGTPAYSSPESLLYYEYSRASDVYSFAMIAYEVITGMKPFGNVHCYMLMAKLTRKERPQIPKSTPAAYKKLIEKCWSELIEERLTFEDILNSLQNDREFLLDGVDEANYQRYILYINQLGSSFCNENILISTNEYIERLRLFENFTKYYLGNGVDVDKAKAVMYCKEAADKGSSAAMFNMSVLLSKGEGVQRDPHESLKYCIESANRGNIAAMKKCVVILYNGCIEDGIEANQKVAIHFCKEAADLGDSEMMRHYAGILYDGKDVPQDKEASAKYYKMAADSGDVESMRIVGQMMKDVNDVEGSAVYMKMAADNGDAVAMNVYAGMLFMGRGVQKDAQKGTEYCRMAAEKGLVSAMVNYAAILEAGDGVDADVETAAKFYKRAAECGHIGAMKKYEQMQCNGKGVSAE